MATRNAAAAKPQAAPDPPEGAEVIDLIPAWVMEGGAASKLAWIQAHIGDVEKTGNNTHQKFKYFQEHGIFALLRPYQRALHVAFKTSLVEPSHDGNMSSARVSATIIDCDRTDPEDPLREVTEWSYMQATDNQGWGAAKLQTYAKKFALQKLCHIPTDDLPEAEAEGIPSTALGDATKRKASKEEVAKLRQALTDAAAGGDARKFGQKVKAKLQADFAVETIDDLTAAQLPNFQQWVLDETAKGS